MTPLKPAKWQLCVLCLLCIFSVSCKDEEETVSGVVEVNEQKLAQRDALASVLTILTGQSFSNSNDIDFEGKTYEPLYGEVLDESNLLERSVLVRNLMNAEGYFRTLAGAGSSLMTETSDGYQFDLSNLDCHSTGKKQNLGTLTFHRDNSSNRVAYADVNIACIPNLRRISYKTEEQWGDNARFESPCEWGDVYVKNGKYYVCVRESRGYNSSGALVCMENGKGTNFKDPIGDGDKGVWQPEHVGTTQDIVDYLILCADETYTRQKQRIVNKYPGKVFPQGKLLNALPNKFSDTVYDGFSSSHPGYSHWADGSERFVKDTKVFICRDGTEGNYVFLFMGWYRRFHHVQISARNEWDKGATEQVAMFKKSNIENLNGKLAKHFLYTASIVHFTDKVPNGFNLVDI